MLVLTRLVGQAILIDSSMRITLAASDRVKVTLLIEQEHFFAVRSGQTIETLASAEFRGWRGFEVELGVGESVEVSGVIICISALTIRGGAIGISAPRTVKVMREELLSVEERALAGTIWG